LSLYERILESVISLFIPFYDEFKSLALLFLILTRARVGCNILSHLSSSNQLTQGAEPIYLHLIRPLIKPYTRTLDATLDVLLMTGDFMFALSTYPIRLVLDWWNKRYALYYEPFETEQETQTETDSSNDVNTSEMPTSFLASSGVVNASPEPLPVQIPSKSARTESRRPSADTITGSISRGKRPENPGIEPDFFPPRKGPTRRPFGSPSGKEPNPVYRNGSSDASTDPSLAQNLLKPLKSQTASPGVSRHQIWYPPTSSYSDDEHVAIQADVTIQQSSQRITLYCEEEEVEEWRKYPPLPSAYPPTPIATTSKLLPALPSLHPTIEEEPQQGFRKSLLPPREPLNPSPAGDLSDKHNTFGISPLLSDDLEDADDSMSTSDYEEEEEFNITLRTPLQPMGSLRSQIRPRRLAAVPSGSSAVSVPSRSSALTTIDNGSSLRTNTSSDSPPSPINTNPSSILGKKRSYPRSNKALRSGTPRVRQIEEDADASADASQDNLAEVTATLRPAPGKSAKSSYPRIVDPNSDVADESAAAKSTTSASPIHTDEQEHEQVQPEEKRRKIVRSSASKNTRGAYIASPVRPVRARVTRHASPPLRNSQKVKLVGIRTSKRPATRAATARAVAGLSTDLVKDNDALMGISSSASVSDHSLPPPVPRKPSKRSTHRSA